MNGASERVPDRDKRRNEVASALPDGARLWETSRAFTWFAGESGGDVSAVSCRVMVPRVGKKVAGGCSCSLTNGPKEDVGGACEGRSGRVGAEKPVPLDHRQNYDQHQCKDQF